MRSVPSPAAGTRRRPAARRPALAGGQAGPSGRVQVARPAASAVTATRPEAPADRPRRSTRSDRPRRAQDAELRDPRPAPSGRAPRRGQVPEHQRAALADVAAGIAAVAVVCIALALLALPSAPTGVAIGAGAVVSALIGWAAVTLWIRWAVADGAPERPVRRRAAVALVTAHVVAAVPVTIAVVLAG